MPISNTPDHEARSIGKVYVVRCWHWEVPGEHLRVFASLEGADRFAEERAGVLAESAGTDAIPGAWQGTLLAILNKLADDEEIDAEDTEAMLDIEDSFGIEVTEAELLP